MAVFYDLTRPTSPLTISPLEVLSSGRPKKKPQFIAKMPDGTIRQQGLGNPSQEVIIKFDNLPAADKDALYNYIESTVGWGGKRFDFDDDQGVEYSNCRWITSQLSNDQHKLNLYRDTLRIIVEPA